MVVIRILLSRLGWIAGILLPCGSRMKFSRSDRDLLLKFPIVGAQAFELATRFVIESGTSSNRWSEVGKLRMARSIRTLMQASLCLCAFCSPPPSDLQHAAKLLASHGARGNNVSKANVSQKNHHSRRASLDSNAFCAPILGASIYKTFEVLLSCRINAP